MGSLETSNGHQWKMAVDRTNYSRFSTYHLLLRNSCLKYTLSQVQRPTLNHAAQGLNALIWSPGSQLPPD